MSEEAEPKGREYDPYGGSGPGAASEEEAQAGAAAAGEQAEQIASEETDVRERVRQLVVETVQDRRLSLDQLNEVTQQVLRGAAEGAKGAAEGKQDSVLRDVVDGLADAYTSAANATRLAVEEANERGKTFAEEDLNRAMRQLRTIDRRFLETIRSTAERGWGTLSEEAGSVKEHAERAVEQIRPAMEAAVRSAARQPGRFGTEAAAASVEAGRQTAGRLLQAVSGLLQGAGEALAERPKDEKKKK